MDVVELRPADFARVAEIDRSEHVGEVFELAGGELVVRPAAIDDPGWDRAGDGYHSLAAVLREWQPVVDGPGVLLAVEGDAGLAGIAIVVPEFEPSVAWLAFLYVSRPWRRRGVGAALWKACEQRARDAGAEGLLVSSVRAGPSVRFYLRMGCEPARVPHPELRAREPDDLQLVKPLG